MSAIFLARALAMALILVASNVAVHHAAEAGVSMTTAEAAQNITVIGGDRISEPYPFAVALPDCGASLIAPTWILTAAHCIATTPATEVRLGHEWRDPGEVRKIKQWVSHPSADRPGFDVALGELASPAGPGASVIVMSDRAPTAGTPTRIIGWGFFTREPPQVQSPYLRQLDTSIRPAADCGAAVDSADSVFNAATELCTDNPDNKGPCHKDSGSAQIVKVADTWALIGVANRSTGLACGFNPSVYASVPAHLSCIRTVIGSSSPRVASSIATPVPTHL